MLQQLSQFDNRFMTSFSSLTSIILNKTSINQSKLKNLLQSLNFYTFNHRNKLSRVKKTIDLMSVNLILARNATKVFFKTNMIKKTRKKTKENEKTFRISFERVLIENEVIRLCEDEIKKIKNVMLKKIIAKTKKSVAAEKKRIHAKKMIIKKKAKKRQISQEIKKDLEIKEILSSSTSKFFDFSVFDFANEKNSV
jgi:hypothetical protein